MKYLILFMLLANMATAQLEFERIVWHPGLNVFTLYAEDNIEEAYITIEDRNGVIMFSINSKIESEKTDFVFEIPTNVKSGNYVIRVETVDENNTFSTEYTNIKIENKNSIWKRWWYIIMDFFHN